MRFSPRIFRARSCLSLGPHWAELPWAHLPLSLEKESVACLFELLRRKLSLERIGALLFTPRVRPRVELQAFMFPVSTRKLPHPMLKPAFQAVPCSLALPHLGYIHSGIRLWLLQLAGGALTNQKSWMHLISQNRSRDLVLSRERQSVCPSSTCWGMDFFLVLTWSSSRGDHSLFF